MIGRDDMTACEYRTGHRVMLWPVKVTMAEYVARDLSRLSPPRLKVSPKAGIRIRLETTENSAFSDFDLDELTFFIRGGENFPMRIYEQIIGHGKNVVVQPPKKPFGWQHVLPSTSIQRVGLPMTRRFYQ